MARLPYLSADDLPADRAELLARPINLFRALAHNPAVLEWMVGIGRWIRYGCALDPRLRELAILQVGYLTRSEYEFTHHVQIGFDFGVTRQDLDALAEEAAGQRSDLPERDRLVLSAARELTIGTTLSDELWEALVAELGSAETLDLVFVVTHYVQVVRVLGTLRIDVEPEYEQYLPLLDGRARSDEQ